MTTIDHPLLEAERALRSGFLDPEAMDRIAAESLARPRTAAQMRESIFEILGPGYRGRLPAAIEGVVDPVTSLDSLGVECWLAIAVVDDGSVLELAGGSWFGVERPNANADRRMIGFKLETEADAIALQGELDGGHRPVWAVPATVVFDLGSEREYRSFMDADQ